MKFSQSDGIKLQLKTACHICWMMPNVNQSRGFHFFYWFVPVTDFWLNRACHFIDSSHCSWMQTFQDFLEKVANLLDCLQPRLNDTWIWNRSRKSSWEYRFDRNTCGANLIEHLQPRLIDTVGLIWLIASHPGWLIPVGPIWLITHNPGLLIPWG